MTTVSIQKLDEYHRSKQIDHIDHIRGGGGGEMIDE